MTSDKTNRNGEMESSVTTPCSIGDDEKYLVSPYVVHPRIDLKSTWYKKEKIPTAIIFISLLEIMFYLITEKDIQRALQFDPTKQFQLWRFLTYMLLHDDWFHLVLNVIMQSLYAYFLEYSQGSLRVGFLYLAGGVTGVLGASCVHPDIVIGASAGVYALLISLASDLMLNFYNMKYKIYRIVCILIIVSSDIVFNLLHMKAKEEPRISWGAHIVGGISGLLLGLIIYRINDSTANTIRRKVFFCSGLILYIMLLISLVILTFQIKKCNPIKRTNYVYFC